MRFVLLSTFLLAISFGFIKAADPIHPVRPLRYVTPKLRLRLEASVLDMPQNLARGGQFPSMQQSLQLANDFYELGYWGIDALGDWLIKPYGGHPRRRKIFNQGLKYGMSLAFVRWGSDLPIPLGTWAHEEFHRSVLGLQGIKAKNGNWFLQRWDGTVFGATDEDLRVMKANALPELLRSYTAGIEAQNLISRSNVIPDFFTARALPKNALYLYNAWYVWNYFRISCSPLSDDVKGFAPDFSPADERERDFAGLDLTAWAYDMTEPGKDYLQRDTMAGLTRANRYVGFSDLQAGAQKFLIRQRNLSLLNFVQPAIFFKPQFRLGPSTLMSFFMQYSPTPFGNAISLTVPFSTNRKQLWAAVYAYNNNDKHFPGLEVGLYRYRIKPYGKMLLSATVNGWMQPQNQDFYAQKSQLGGAVMLRGDYPLVRRLSVFASASYKTAGWQMGNPYLDSKWGASAGLTFTYPHRR